MPRGVYSVAEVAEILGVNVKTVRNMFARGTLPGTKLGARWYVNIEQLQSLIGPLK